MSYGRKGSLLVGGVGVGKTTIYTRFKMDMGLGGSLNTVKDCEFTKPVMVSMLRVLRGKQDRRRGERERRQSGEGR